MMMSVTKLVPRPQTDCPFLAVFFFLANYSGLISGVHGENPALLDSTFQKQNRVGLVLSSDAIEGITLRHTPIQFTAKLTNEGEQVAKGILTWSSKGPKTSLIENSLPTTVAAGETKVFPLTVTLDKAGFAEVVCEFQQDDAAKPARKTLRVGCDPDKLTSTLTRQPDFDDFWKQAIAELNAIPPAFKLVERVGLSNEHIQIFEVSMRSHDQIRVRGWLEMPRKRSKPLPAVIRVPGYGQNMKPVGKSNDMIVFSFNPRGHGNSQQDVPGKPNDFWIRGLDTPHTYYYRGSYLDCIRAVDFIASHANVDQDKIAVWGGSQGGGFAFATAALDPRVDLCVSDIPFLCDWINYFRLTQWPEMDEWIADQPHRNWRSTLRTMSYFDTMNMADRINCRTLMSVGLQDSVCPPTTCFHTFNRIPADKTFRIYPNKRHGLGKEHYAWVWTQIRKEFAASE